MPPVHGSPLSEGALNIAKTSSTNPIASLFAKLRAHFQTSPSPLPNERVVTTPLPDAIQTTPNVRIASAASHVLPVVLPPRPPPTFRPMEELSSENIPAAEQFMRHIETWLSFAQGRHVPSLPIFDGFQAPPNVMREALQGKTVSLSLEDRKNSVLENVLFDLRLSLGFADIASSCVRGEDIQNPHVRRSLGKLLSSGNPQELKKHIRGIYDEQGNLQAIGIVSEKMGSNGKVYYIDRLATAPWNFVPQLRNRIRNLGESTLGQPTPTLAVLQSVETWLSQIPEDHRSVKGAGLSLLQHMCRDAESKGYKRIELQPAGNSHSFYERCGFREVTTMMEGMKMVMDIDEDPHSPFQLLLRGRQEAAPPTTTSS